MNDLTLQKARAYEAEHGAAISPADNGPGCFSGSATEMDDGKQLLMYTSVIAEKQPNGEMRDIQTQSIAIGDGLDYEKPACNPVLTACPQCMGAHRTS